MLKGITGMKQKVNHSLIAVSPCLRVHVWVIVRMCVGGNVGVVMCYRRCMNVGGDG